MCAEKDPDEVIRNPAVNMNRRPGLLVAASDNLLAARQWIGDKSPLHSLASWKIGQVFEVFPTNVAVSRLGPKAATALDQVA
jgi:hypothetical protein